MPIEFDPKLQSVKYNKYFCNFRNVNQKDIY